MAELHLFGTGYVRVGAVGAALTNVSNGIGSIQSIDSNVKFDKKELYNTPVVAMFAVDVGFSKGAASVKLEFNDINRNLFPIILGAVKTTAAAVDTYTITGTSKPTLFRLEFDMLSNDAVPKNYKGVFYNCYCVEMPITSKLDDFSSETLEIFAILDPTTGNIGTLALDE